MTVAGIPMPFIVFVLMIVVISFIMGKTKFGKRVHLVGTVKASKFAGINTVSVLIRAYMLSGIVSAVAGLLSLSRINSARQTSSAGLYHAQTKMRSPYLVESTRMVVSDLSRCCANCSSDSSDCNRYYLNMFPNIR